VGTPKTLNAYTRGWEGDQTSSNYRSKQQSKESTVCNTVRLKIDVQIKGYGTK